MSRIPVIIDCDPGHDDAIALLMAFASEKLDVRGVTVVAGNQTMDKTLNNCLKVLSYAGVKVDVAAGCDRPLVRDLITAPEVHGDSGLDGPELPDPDFGALPIHAVELIANILRDSSEKVTLIPTGPLTNIGLFLIRYPELKEKVEKIVLMGGAAKGGNWTPAAEFNILVDPEAADLVFKSGIPVVMCGLDVTHEANVYADDIKHFHEMGGKVAKMVGELLDFFAKYHVTDEFFGAHLHDPVAVGYVIAPEIFNMQSHYVAIETKGELTLGSTVVDFYDRLKKPHNALVGFGVDREAFVNLLFDLVGRYK